MNADHPAGAVRGLLAALALEVGVVTAVCGAGTALAHLLGAL